MNAMMRILLRPSGYGGTGLSFTFGALRWVYFIYALNARGPATFSEFSSVVAFGNFCFLIWSELSAFTATPTGVSAIVPCDGLIGLRNVAGECCEEFESIELGGYIVFCGIGNDIILPAVAMLAFAEPS